MAGSESNTELLRLARERFDAAWEADRPNREEALDDLRFIAGEQWPEDLRQEREAENRPVITENRLPQFVRQIVSDIRQQKPSIRVRPVDDESDPKVAEVMTSLIRDIEGQSATLQPYVRAAESAVRCGIGHFRILTQYSRIGGFDQEIKLEPIDNPFAVVWDPLARDITREDARYCFITEMISREDFKASYPKAKAVDFDNGDLPESQSHLGNWYDQQAIRIAEYWYHKPIKRTYLRFPEGQIEELGEGEEPPPGVESREVEDRAVCYVKMSGLEVLEGPTEWLTRDIPIIPVVGEEINIGDRVVRVGAVRYAKEPQFLFNVWLSTQTELLGLQPKAPYMATPKQIEGFESLWREANTKNRPVLFYNPDPQAGGIPQRVMPPQASGAFTEQLLMAADAMKATTGVYDAALGAKSNETSGVAIEARKQQASSSAFVFTDNLTASVRRAGRIVLDLIPKIYDAPRVVRILGEDGGEDFKRINTPFQADPNSPVEHYDLTVGRYDLTISTGPAYASKRAEAADAMMQFLQTAPQSANLVMDLIAKNMDWPGADEFAERFKKALPPGIAPEEKPDDQQAMAEAQAKEQAGQMQQMAMQADLKLKVAQAEKADAEAKKAIAEAHKAESEAMLTQLQLTREQAIAIAGIGMEETGQPEGPPPDVQALNEPPPMAPEAPMGPDPTMDPIQ